MHAKMFYRASTLLFCVGVSFHRSDAAAPTYMDPHHHPHSHYLPVYSNGVSVTSSKTKTSKSGAVHYWPYPSTACSGVVVNGDCVHQAGGSGQPSNALINELPSEVRVQFPLPKLRPTKKVNDVDKVIAAEKERMHRFADANQQYMARQLHVARADDAARLKPIERELGKRQAKLAAAEKRSRASQAEKARLLKAKQDLVNEKVKKLRGVHEKMKAREAAIKAKEEELARQAEELKISQAASVSAAEQARTSAAESLQQQQAELAEQAAKLSAQEAEHQETRSLLDKKATELSERETVSAKEKAEMESRQQSLTNQRAELDRAAEALKQRQQEHDSAATQLKDREESLRQKEEQIYVKPEIVTVPQIDPGAPGMSPSPNCVSTHCTSGIVIRNRNRRSKNTIEIYRV